MSECQICGRNATGTDGYRCNHCEEVHCGDHRLPEKHDCVALRAGAVDSPRRSQVGEEKRRGGGVQSPEPMDVDENRSPRESTSTSSADGSPDLNPDGTIAGSSSSNSSSTLADRPSVLERLRSLVSGYRWRLRSYRAKVGFFLGAAIIVIGMVNAVTGDGITGLPTIDFYRPLVSYAYKDSLYATGGTQLLADLLFVMLGVVILVRR